jgi:putative oxidoreductase
MNKNKSLSFLSHPDVGLLFLRVAGSFMLFYVHGLPKVLHYGSELTKIEDPFGFGAQLSLWAAILAEFVCPLFIAAGMFTRLACLPVIGVLLIAMLAVHPGWSIPEGQFGWLLLVIFIAIALGGPGRWRLAFPGRRATVH